MFINIILPVDATLLKKIIQKVTGEWRADLAAPERRLMPLFCKCNSQQSVGFEVLTAVVMKCTVFWDTTPCSPLKINRRFGGIYHLHLQGRKISRARNRRESRNNDFTDNTRVFSCLFIFVL
jgi:hypothetical protein